MNKYPLLQMVWIPGFFFHQFRKLPVVQSTFLSLSDTMAVPK